MNKAVMSKAHEAGGDWTSSERLASAFLTLRIAGTSKAKTKTITEPENELPTYETALRSPQARE